MKNYLNYKSEDAENLKKTYSSWIGRGAHTGHGKTQVLKDIIITKHQLERPLEDTAIYKVEFVFENGDTLNSYEFLNYNSLISADSRSGSTNKKNQDVA